MADLQQQTPRIVTLPEIEGITSTPEFAKRLIDAIGDGFVSFSSGCFNACPIQTMGAPPMAPFAGADNEGDGKEYAAQTCVKSGYVTGASHYVIKVASGGHPFPNSGSMQLYSQRSGRLEAILLDEGLLTELRTAAAGAVAARLLAPDMSDASPEKCIGILGTGIQARYQLRYLAHVTPCRKVKVWGRTKENVQKFSADMASEGWSIREVDSPKALLAECSLVVTTTSSREPLLKYIPSFGRSVDEAKSAKKQRHKLDLQHPLHITCIGSDATGKIELDPELVSKADLLVADSRLQTEERGEFEEVLKRNLVSLDSIVELGELIERKKPPRGADCGDGLTIFDSSGVAVQDCIVAAMVHEALEAKAVT